MQHTSRKLRTMAAAAALILSVAVPSALAQSAPKRAETARVLVVSIPDRKIALLEDGKVVKVYPVAVGAEVSASPEGDFQIINRLERPSYYGKKSVIGPGPANPLGTRWMGLSKKSYGIHGTNEEDSIGKAASHGCIRMHRRDLEDLFARVRVGDKVMIRAKRDDLLSQIFGATGDQVEVAGITATKGNATGE